MMKNYNILLISLSGLLILINSLLLMEYEPEVNRWGRKMSTLVFLALFLKDFYRSKILLLGAFLMLLISDFFILTYQNTGSQQAFFAFQSLAYLFLIIHVGKYLVKEKFRAYQLIYFSIVVVLNTFFIVVIGDLFAEEVQQPRVEVLFYVYGFFTIFFISAGILYYDRFSNDISACFLLAVVGLVFSNLMAFPAHFMEFWEIFYLDRLFYVLGTAGLAAYSYYSGKAFSSGSRKPSLDHLQDL